MAQQTPAKFVHDGSTIDYTPGADTPAGAVVVQADLLGVAPVSIKAGQLGGLSVVGVYDFPKAGGAGSGAAAGTLFYWDAVALAATKNAAAGVNKLLGKSIKVTVDADAFVRIRMQQ